MQHRRLPSDTARWPARPDGAAAMPPSSARALATEIFGSELEGARTAAAAAVAAERVFQRLSENLVRWVGAEGSQALFARARTLAQTRSEALRVIPPPARSALFLDALVANSEPHDPAPVIEGAMTIVVALIELLARLVGEDLALKLLTEGGSNWPSSGGRTPSRERTP